MSRIPAGPLRAPLTWRRLTAGAALALGWLLAALIVVVNKLVELAFNNAIPGRDSGVFLTIAQGILAGRIPYRDFWDHKPPGIYYIDALILRVLPPLPSSLHLAEIVVALVALLVLYRFLRAFASRGWSLFGLLLFALFATHPYTNEGGNFTETYALLPVIAAHTLLLAGWRRPRPLPLPFFAAGALIALAALIRPQEAAHLLPALAVALSPALSARGQVAPGASGKNRGVTAIHAAALFLGLMLVLGLVMLYFAAHRALGDLFAQVIAYNLSYSSAVPLRSGLASLANTLVAFPAHPFLIAGALVLGLLGLAALLARGEGRVAGVLSPAATVGGLLSAAWLLLELAGLALGGRYYNHYFLVIVPPAVALIVWGLARLTSLPSGSPRSRPSAAIAPLLALVLAGGSLFLWNRDIRPWQAQLLPLVRVERLEPAVPLTPLPGIASVPPGEAYTVLRLGHWRLAVVRQPPSAEERVALWLAANVPPGVPVEVWGANAALYFLSGRPTATRYIYNFPLIGRIGDTLSPSPELPALQAGYIAELVAARPAALVVAPDRLDPAAGDRLERIPALAALIVERYRLVHEDEGFRVYYPR